MWRLALVLSLLTGCSFLFADAPPENGNSGTGGQADAASWSEACQADYGSEVGFRQCCEPAESGYWISYRPDDQAGVLTCADFCRQVDGWVCTSSQNTEGFSVCAPSGMTVPCGTTFPGLCLCSPSN